MLSIPCIYYWFTLKNDYFIQKDQLKKSDDQYVDKYNQKVFIQLNRQTKSNFTILEYTKVLSQSKFCHKKDELIFGEQYPYKNCR